MSELDGIWSLKVTLPSQGGTGRVKLMEGDGGALTGEYTGALGRQSLTGAVKGSGIEFGFDSQAGRITYRGSVSGHKMEGTCSYGLLGEGTFEGVKSEASETSVATPAAKAEDEREIGTSHMLGGAGRLIDRQSMVWIRRLDAPVEGVWEAVSTKEGLNHWWLPTKEIDLRPGGTFSHHWESRVNAFKKHEYIDFGDVTFSGAGMRFELQPDGDGTRFAFLDNWGEGAAPQRTEGQAPWLAAQPGGPGTPWSGVAAGWHGMIDALESYLTGKTFEHTYEDLCKLYARYLADHYRWLELMPAKREAEKQRND